MTAVTLFFTITGADFRREISRARRTPNDVSRQIRERVSIFRDRVIAGDEAGQLPEAKISGSLPASSPSLKIGSHPFTKANERNVSACESGDVNARDVGTIFQPN